MLTFGALVHPLASASPSESSFFLTMLTQLRPNVVFLVVESTDGRTWQRGYQNSVIPLRDQGTALPATERYLTSATSLHWVARC